MAGVVLAGACTDGGQPGDGENAFRFSAVKPIATLKNVGHYTNVEGVRDAIGPVVIVRD